MALRIRKSGQIVCAAMHPPEAGDTYIPDNLSYQMTVENEVLTTDESHSEHGLWWWSGTGDE